MISLLRGAPAYFIPLLAIMAFGGYLSMPIASSEANAQTTPTRSKVVVKNNPKQTGIKAPRPASQSLAPKNSSLVDASKDSELNRDAGGNLDFRVQRGCIKTDSLDGNLPARLGINDPAFFEFFQSQSRQSSECSLSSS